MKNKWLILSVIGIATFILAILLTILFNMLNGSQILNYDTNLYSKSLPIPPLLEPFNVDEKSAEYLIKVQSGTTNIIGDKSTPTLGYNGSFLGPVLKVDSGKEVSMHIVNELDEETSVHWHGLEVEGSKDGGPHQVIPAGSSWNPTFTINQPASTLWYHPHVIGSTAKQVYYGLAGLIIIEDENSKSLGLPNDYGINDIPIILQDKNFNKNGSLYYDDNMKDGAIGNFILVNGGITPNLEVDQIKMRFRLVNGANSRNFNLRLSDNSRIYQIASDGGLLEKPVSINNIFISPGERAEIVIDFSKYDQGDVIELISGNKLVMTFHVGGKSLDETRLPEVLTTIDRMNEDEASGFKSIELDGMGRMVSLNGRKFDINRTDDNVSLGDIEIWEIYTNSGMMMGSPGHPFHIHGTQFQIISRNGFEPDENERGWKDTVFVGSGERIRIIVKFKYKGMFMYHCHILEHEEAGMMGQLMVE